MVKQSRPPCADLEDIRIVDMADDKVQKRVGEVFVGAFAKDSQLMTMNFQVVGMSKVFFQTQILMEDHVIIKEFYRAQNTATN